jgi:hypothetical protein
MAHRINVRNTPGNHLKWGKLVKTWATGRDYVNHPISDQDPFPPDNPPQAIDNPRPTTFAQLVSQCKAIDCELYFDDGVNDQDVQGNEPITLEVIQRDSNTMILRLPPPDKIKESELRLLQPGETYTLPQFYERIHETLPKPEQTTTPSQKATLHAERVGEYTINTCA